MSVDKSALAHLLYKCTASAMHFRISSWLLDSKFDFCSLWIQLLLNLFGLENHFDDDGRAHDSLSWRYEEPKLFLAMYTILIHWDRNEVIIYWQYIAAVDVYYNIVSRLLTLHEYDKPCHIDKPCGCKEARTNHFPVNSTDNKIKISWELIR